jgi:hypothetical protein
LTRRWSMFLLQSRRWFFLPKNLSSGSRIFNTKIREMTSKTKEFFY